MSKKWPGGIITPTPATPTGPYQDGAAPGIWTLSQQSYWAKQGLWPIAGAGPTPIGLVAGGTTTGSVNTEGIQKVNVTSEGTAISYGNLTATYLRGALGNSTTAVFAGNGLYNNTICYKTISSSGDCDDFGDLTAGRACAGCCNDTRGIWAGGRSNTPSSLNIIDYITIASTGNATDFGDLTIGRENMGPQSVSDTTTAIFAAGYPNTGTTGINVIDYVIISSTGNATDFGDLTVGILNIASGEICSSTRGIFGTGSQAGGGSNVVNYITMSSTGNATSFGNLISSQQSGQTCSSKITGLFTRDSASGGIQKITIATTGNSVNFGTLSVEKYNGGGCSNSHGGLA